MKYLVTLLILLTATFAAQSQTYEVGGYIGGANVIGDVGNTQYINPNSLAFGGIFRWNRSERHSFRFSAIRAKVEGNDADSGEERRQQRGLSFENTITELSLGMEYTFWEFNLNSGNPVSAPYLYTGITFFFYEESYLIPDAPQRFYDQGKTFAIPISLGYKTTLSTNILASLEIGARYSFTDNLDGSNPERAQDSELLRFGNINNNDWYVFTGITFSFTFGRQPCYCNF